MDDEPIFEPIYFSNDLDRISNIIVPEDEIFVGSTVECYSELDDAVFEINDIPYISESDRSYTTFSYTEDDLDASLQHTSESLDPEDGNMFNGFHYKEASVSEKPIIEEFNQERLRNSSILSTTTIDLSLIESSHESDSSSVRVLSPETKEDSICVLSSEGGSVNVEQLSSSEDDIINVVDVTHQEEDTNVPEKVFDIKKYIQELDFSVPEKLNELLEIEAVVFHKIQDLRHVLSSNENEIMKLISQKNCQLSNEQKIFLTSEDFEEKLRRKASIDKLTHLVNLYKSLRSFKLVDKLKCEPMLDIFMDLLKLVNSNDTPNDVPKSTVKSHLSPSLLKNNFTEDCRPRKRKTVKIIKPDIVLKDYKRKKTPCSGKVYYDNVSRKAFVRPYVEKDNHVELNVKEFNYMGSDSAVSSNTNRAKSSQSSELEAVLTESQNVGDYNGNYETVRNFSMNAFSPNFIRTSTPIREDLIKIKPFDLFDAIQEDSTQNKVSS